MSSPIKDRRPLQSSKGFTPLPNPGEPDVCATCKGSMTNYEADGYEPEYHHKPSACPQAMKQSPRYVERLRKRVRRNMKRMGVRPIVKS